MLQKSFLLLVALACAGIAQAKPQPLEAKINMNGIKGTFRFDPPTKKDPSTLVTIEITKGLKKETYPTAFPAGFQYHIHVHPVVGKDCSTAEGHLDPTGYGTGPCTAPKEKCQQGDLSGKHGNLIANKNGSVKKFSYNDKQVHFTGVNTTIHGRSVVIHNGVTRIACANLLPVKTPKPAKKVTGPLNVV